MLDALRELIERPSSDPTAAATVVAIVVLAAILAVLVLVILGLPRREREDGQVARISPKVRRWTARFAAASGLLLLAAVSIVYGMTSTDSYCGERCHAMSAENASWRASSHASVSCVRCHEGRPVLSVLAAVAVRGRSLQAHMSGRRLESGSAIPSRRCLECHAEVVRRQTRGQDGLVMSHAEVVAEGRTCESCHGDQGHELAGARPPMRSCLPCHDGERASAACGTCHRGEGLASVPATRTAAAGAYRRVPLPAATDPCAGCHPSADCDACHKLHMPHPDRFATASGHARAAAFQRRESVCYGCHTPSDCSECHRDFGFHGSPWRRRHAVYPRGTRYCAGCHSSPDMCALCHGG